MKYLNMLLFFLLNITCMYAMETKVFIPNIKALQLFIPLEDSLDTLILELGVYAKVIHKNQELQTVCAKKKELFEALKNQNSKSKILTQQENTYKIKLIDSDEDLSQWDKPLFGAAGQYVIALHSKLIELTTSDKKDIFKESIEKLEQWKKREFIE